MGAGPTPRVSEWMGLKWGLRSSVSTEFPGDADAADPGTHSEPQLQQVHGE